MLRFGKLLRSAHDIVLSSPQMRYKHVAWILQKNRIVSIGVNSCRTHPIAKRLKIKKLAEGQCAELNACLKVGLSHKDGLPDFSRFDMLIVRINKSGNFGNSRPCAGCRELIRQCGFHKVWYSDAKGEIKQYAF
jgi:deoxycytidylate deaminase